MTPEEFTRRLRDKAKEVQNYSEHRFPVIAGNTTLRFIDGNFRGQGYQGNTFNKWKPNRKKGTTLVKSGAMRAGNYYTTQIAQATIKNTEKYARTHNQGFSGKVSIPAHTRNHYSKTKVGTGRFTKTGKERTITQTAKSGSSMVRAHSRNVNIPKRQFMPISASDSPVLVRAIRRNITNDFNLMFR